MNRRVDDEPQRRKVAKAQRTFPERMPGSGEMNGPKRGLAEPDERTNRTARVVVDAAVEVHRELGPGYTEVVYEEALCVELQARRIAFVRQPVVEVIYKGRKVGEGRLDLLVDSCLVVELKAIDALADVHTAQLLSYLKATGRNLGLLINFNVPVLKQGIRRVVRGAK